MKKCLMTPTKHCEKLTRTWNDAGWGEKINSQSLEDAQAGVREGFGDQMFPNMLALAKLVSDVWFYKSDTISDWFEATELIGWRQDR